MENISDISYDAIKYFISVARHGSISKAALALQISQSALSQAMKNLEVMLGFTLFNRNTRGIVLTQEGEILFQEATEGEKHFRKAIINAKQIANLCTPSSFKISASRAIFSFCLESHIKEILNKFPKINLEILAYYKEKDVVRVLQSEDIDLCFVKASKNFFLKEVECKPVKKLHYKVCYNPSFVTLPEKVNMEDIKKYVMLIKARDEVNDSSWMEYSFPQTIVCRDDTAVLELIKDGVGIGLFPQEFAERFGLKTVEVEGFQKVERCIYACFNSSNKIAKEIAKLVADI